MTHTHGHSLKAYVPLPVLLARITLAKAEGNHYLTKTGHRFMRDRPYLEPANSGNGHPNAANVARRASDFEARLGLSDARREIDFFMMKGGAAVPMRLGKMLQAANGDARVSEPLWYHLNQMEEHAFGVWLRVLADCHPESKIEIEPETRKLDLSKIILENRKENLERTLEGSLQAAKTLRKLIALKELLPSPNERKNSLDVEHPYLGAINTVMGMGALMLDDIGCAVSAPS